MTPKFGVAPLVKTPKSLSRGPQMSPEMRARLTGPGGALGPHMAAPKQQRPLGGGPGVKLMPAPGIPSGSAQERDAAQAFEAQRKAQMSGMGAGPLAPKSQMQGTSPASPTQSQMQAQASQMAGLGAAMKSPMMKSGGEVKREVDSLASRYPKKGIDPTIPAGVREKLVEQEREKMFKAGEKAHSERTLAKGGSAKAYAKGGVTRADGCARKGHTKGRYI